MEDYIFIIIAIVLTAIGAMNKNKKKREQQMVQEDDHVREPSIFDQFFDDPVFEDEKPMAVPPPIVRVIPEKKEMEKRPLQAPPPLAGSIPEMKRRPLQAATLTAGSIPELKKREMRVSSLRTGSLPERRKIKTSFAEEEEQKVDVVRSSIMDGFSGKKAVIYAEILNRKY